VHRIIEQAVLLSWHLKSTTLVGHKERPPVCRTTTSARRPTGCRTGRSRRSGSPAECASTGRPSKTSSASRLTDRFELTRDKREPTRPLVALAPERLWGGPRRGPSSPSHNMTVRAPALPALRASGGPVLAGGFPRRENLFGRRGSAARLRPCGGPHPDRRAALRATSPFRSLARPRGRQRRPSPFVTDVGQDKRARFADVSSRFRLYYAGKWPVKISADGKASVLRFIWPLWG
jgi:hypothetical protein